MMHVRKFILVLALLLAPAPLVAQERPHPEGHPRPMLAEAMERRGPLAALLRDREALGLTPAQVTQIEAIQQRLLERNRPLVEQLLRLRQSAGDPPRVRPQEMTPEQRQAWERRVEQARPIMRQIHENNRQAMQEVGTVLTEQQKQQIRERIRERESKVRERGGPRRGHGPPGARGDTLRGRAN